MIKKAQDTRPVADSATMRRINDAAVLEILRRQGTVSRTEIWKQSGLSRSAVTGIIRDLKKKGFIKEAGEAESSGGRRPQLISFNPTAYWTVGVDLEEGLAAVMDLSGRIKNELEFELPRRGKPGNPLQHVIAAIQDVVAQSGVGRRKILGTGIAMPGIVNHGQGLLLFSSELNWSNVPVKTIVEQGTGIPTLVDNDVRMSALGEHVSGVGKHVGNLVCLEVGNAGFGAAAILDGMLFRGAHDSAGEIGHIPVIRDGLPCSCGNRGCIERYATGEAVLARAKEAIRAGGGTAIAEQGDGRGGTLTVKHVFAAAACADALATRIVDDLGYYLGLAAVILINSFDPKMVVLRGSLVEQGGDPLVRATRQHINQNMLRSNVGEVGITKTTLGRRAGLAGAGGLVYANAFGAAS